MTRKMYFFHISFLIYAVCLVLMFAIAVIASAKPGLDFNGHERRCNNAYPWNMANSKNMIFDEEEDF